MTRLGLQAQSEESKDPIRGDQLLRPYPHKGGIETRRKEDPRNKEELQSLVGMFNYMGKFVHRTSTLW